ncbi:MAG: redox-sensing transcriptional repressor Rex [Lentisphaerae bacterium]|nr:redox-sensing transcriptional repressor Rex [Lentisphaerota bacterium]
MARTSLPYSVAQRLPRYLMQVQNLRQVGLKWISSQDLADTLGLTSSTVRQDFSHFDFSGIAKRGYLLKGLEAMLAEVLGADANINMVIIGAGNLGRALALHGQFPARGFKIVGLFDKDPRIVGRKVGRLEVQAMKALPGVIRKSQVAIGVITVPAASAQEVADQLIAAGIRGLLNLAYVHLVVPRHVAVVDARIISSLQELSYAIKAKSRPAARRS